MDLGTDRPSRDVLVPEVWAGFYEETHIPAAVRVGDTLRLTGHTGETPDGVFSPDFETQIRQVFRNIALTLAEAGATWSHVVEINSYHVGLLNQAKAVLRVAAEFLEDPYPAWTAVGVTELIIAEALIEISCVAVLQAEIV
jgi:enamine deaminase RidA (YjgF/YER057c/UK114 family)